MFSFEDLVFDRYDEVQARVDFPNGYGISVIKDGYGHEQGLLELAVMAGGHLCYDTPVTSDVEGWLTPDQVTELDRQVEQLPERMTV